MNFDPFTENPIHATGIWTSSRCLSKEDQVHLAVSTHLLDLGYTPLDNNSSSFVHNRIWKRDDRRVAVCLVDSYRTVSDNYHSDLPYLFDRNTTVITDNQVTCPTRYQVIKLPDSFFGIYNHSPVETEWTPERDFTFSVNRIDVKRLKLMLELGWRVHLHKGNVNFNCQADFDGDSFGGRDRLHANFEKFWNYLSEEEQNKWQASFKLLQNLMPIKNYEYSFEQAQTRGLVNFVAETHSEDTVIALSEKIFRALCLPTPWTVYGSKYTVAYLESLGFDCLSDVIDHNHYDRLKEVENKVNIYVWKSLEVVKDLKKMDFAELSQRCQQAADHNQQLLQNYSKSWDQDFAKWRHRALSCLS